MVDLPIFVLGVAAVSIVASAVLAISREDQAAREAAAARTATARPRPSAAARTAAPPAEHRE